MNEIQIFKNDQFGEVRTLVVNNEPYFVGRDVADILGYAKPENAISTHVDDEDKTTTLIQGTGSNYKSKAVIINESGLYSLILSSKLPSAKKFKHWITAEVLPTIRKAGGYVANDEMFINTYLPFADDTVKTMFKSTLETVRAQNELIRKQQKEIQHKEDVIIGLVDKVELAEKRQILNRVVRYKGANFQERWRELYKQFEMKYHIDLTYRLASYNESNKPKLKNKIDYIDKVMGKIPELYEIACKLYESDVKELAHELYGIN